MLTGITDLQLMPGVTGTLDIVKQIGELFENATNARCSIAFWTLSPDQLNSMTKGKGIRVLREKGSFLCVDLQIPTNIDNLAKLVRLGIKVFLNIRKLPREIDPLRISTSRGLLHTKTLLADLPDGRAEIWIGSHNWTVPALIGPNTELSVAFKLARNAPLYLETKHRLKDIRDNYCQPFDLDKVEYYKALQRFYERDTQSKYVVELEGRSVDNLSGQVICVFGTESDDYSAVSAVNKKIFLSVYESDSEDKYLYQGKVIQTGQLSAANPMAEGLELSERRYAFTVGRSFPKLKSAKIPGPEVLTRAHFFANFEVLKYIASDYKLYDPLQASKKASRWSKANRDPAFERMNLDFTEIYYQKKIQLHNLIEVPSDDRKATPIQGDEFYVEYAKVPLAEKRISQDYRLISRRVVEY